MCGRPLFTQASGFLKMTDFVPRFNLDQLQLLAGFAASHLPGVNGIFPITV